MTQHGGAQGQEPQDWEGARPPLPAPGQSGSGLPEIVPNYRPAQRQPQSKIETYFGEVTRTGVYPWAVVTQVNAGLATVKLDLRQIIGPGERMEIRLGAWMATVRIAVPAGTEVDLQVSASVGDARLETDRSSQGVPPTGARLVVSGWSVMSDVRVRAFAAGAKPRSGWRWVGKG